MPTLVTLTLAPASFDTRRRAFIEGHGGSTVNGAYVVLPGTGAAPNRYLWWSHNGYNLDPGTHVPALAGYTGVEVALGSGNHTAAQRATATRTAVNGVSGWVAGGSGAQVTIRGPINPATVATGGAYTARGAAGLFGHHTDADFTNGNPFNDAIAVHGTFTAGPAVLTAVGVLLGTPAGESVRLALYIGGSSVSFTGTTLVAQGIVTATGSGNVWAWLPLTAAQSAAIADNASVWVVAKSNQNGGTLHPAFSNLGGAEEDWTARNLVIFTGGSINVDPAVAFPASLAGLASDIATGNAVVMMAAFEYRTLPLCGDASLGGTTTNGLVLGMHTDGVLTASESALTSPDAGGANVLAALTTPPIIGMLETRRETALHDISSGQMRTAEYVGGSIGNPSGATRLQDHGAVSGSASMAWVGQNASPEVSIPASSVLHIGIRGNGGVAVGFVLGASPESASPPNNPSDFATVASDEYETNTGNPAHSTNDAVAFETPFVTDTDDLTPGNYPGVRVRFRVPGDTLDSAIALSGARPICPALWSD